MKKIKCIKCGLRFKDREDSEDKDKVFKELCWNCRFVWQQIGLMLQALGNNPFMRKRINRYVIIKLEDVIIRKKRKITL